MESVYDLAAFAEFIRSTPVFGFDTETTGLDWWAARDFRCRLAQFGNGLESWVIPVEKMPAFMWAARWALRRAHRIIAHNGGFDLHVVEAACGIPIEELAPKLLDTKLLAHLVNPVPKKDNGIGLKLEDLVREYVDPQAADEVKGSVSALARKMRTTRERVFKTIGLDDEQFLLYAGMDPVLAFRLFHALIRLVPARSRRRGLISWEHRLAHVTSLLERTGYLLDVEYAEARSAELLADQERAQEEANEHGVENVNSVAQLVEAFTRAGVALSKRTPKGGLAMDDGVLSSLDHPLAQVVVRGRRAGKWRKTWFVRALAGRDPNDRVHAAVNSCEARTARMTITGSIPAQTFPAGDGYVRRMFLAEPGHVSASIDFGNMELRVLAAFSGDKTMLEAFRNGLDLHQITADAAGVSRKAGKGTNFTVVFGGGWRAVVEQYGVSEEEAKRAVKAFWETYPGVKKFADRLMQEARRTGYIYTATGRRIPVDRNRVYAALNYFIQSSSRDITARALLALYSAGYTPYARLVIHDEIIFSFPEERAEELAAKAARLMEFTVRGVLVPAEAEIGGRSWGSILDLEASKH